MDNYKIAKSGNGNVLGVPKKNGKGFEVIDKGVDYSVYGAFLILDKEDGTSTIYATVDGHLVKAAEKADVYINVGNYLFFTRGFEYFALNEKGALEEKVLGSFCYPGGLFVHGEENNYTLSYLDEDDILQQKNYVKLEELDASCSIAAEKADGLFDLFELSYDEDFDPMISSFDISLYDDRFVRLSVSDAEDSNHVKLFKMAKEGYQQIYDGHNEIKCANAVLCKDENGVMVLNLYDEDGGFRILASGDEKDFIYTSFKVLFKEQECKISYNERLIVEKKS